MSGYRLVINLKYMKKIITIIVAIIAILLYFYFNQKDKIIIMLENKIKSEEINPLINHYKISNNYIFVNSVWFSSNICRNWRLFVMDLVKKDYLEIFSYKNTDETISPCIYKIDSLNNNEFNMEFCLSEGWWSWECLGMNMMYNIENNIWNEWQLKWININDKTQTALPVVNMDEYELEKYNNFLKWF